MFCGNCGNELPPEYKFCSECGTGVVRAVRKQKPPLRIRFWPLLVLLAIVACFALMMDSTVQIHNDVGALTMVATDSEAYLAALRYIATGDPNERKRMEEAERSGRILRLINGTTAVVENASPRIEGTSIRIARIRITEGPYAGKSVLCSSSALR